MPAAELHLSVVISTDHKPLIWATRRSSRRYTDRETRQLDYSFQFHLQLRSLAGRENVAADTLSRASASSLHVKPALALKHVAAEQKKGGLRIRDCDPHLVESPPDTTATAILCDISMN